MLKIFLSSTYRDLFKIRKKILEEVENVLRGVGMEKFIPDGNNSQEMCIKELKQSQIVIFLISPYYGSLMEDCTMMSSCKADCPMKRGESKISYTHCEYLTTKAEGIQHMTYLIKEGWKEIQNLNQTPKKKFKLDEIKEIPFFEKMRSSTIEHYINICKEACVFKEEIDKEYYKEIENIEDPLSVQMIKNHLADNILKWYFDGKIKFKEFVDRKDELNDLNQSLEKNIVDRVEVYGVGGVGKTSLIQIALLIQRLRGKKIVTIGTRQTYAMGSGYPYAKMKLENVHSEVSIGNLISLDDILNALTVLLPVIPKLKKDIKKITNLIEAEDILLFIDDAHLLDDDVAELIKSTNSIVLSSRERTGLAKKEIVLIGIAKEDRPDLINLLKPRTLRISPEIMEDINLIAEGHPIFTKLLVRNYQLVDFENLKIHKPEELEHAEPNEMDEYLKRLVEEILSERKEALELLKELSVINDDLKNNLHIDCVKAAYDIPRIDKNLNALLKCGLLEKKWGENKNYEFTFKHIQLALEIDSDKMSHERAIEYYKVKEQKIGQNIDDRIEVFFHLFKSNPTEDLVSTYVELAKIVSPIKYSYKRLIEVGTLIKESFQPKDIFQEDHKATIIITLGNLYSKLERYQQAEILYKEASNYIENIEYLIIRNINDLPSTDNIVFLDSFFKFIGNYMVYVSTQNSIEISPWKKLSDKLSKMIDNPENSEIYGNLRLIFNFFANMIGYKSKKLYFSEAKELIEILVPEKPCIERISDACALYDLLKWMASYVKEDIKSPSLRTAELYEEYARVFDEVKRRKSIKEIKEMRPYGKVIESAAWHYHLGQDFIKSAEKYVEIYKNEFEELSLGLQKFILWVAALNFSRGDEKVQSTEYYLKLAEILENTQGISELAIDLYEKALSQLNELSDEFNEISERYQKVKVNFNNQKKLCEKADENALLVSNNYDKVAADGVASFLYLNNINCDYVTNIRTKDELMKYNDDYDYIILHGGPQAPEIGHLIIEFFGNQSGFAKLLQTTYSYKNVWTMKIENSKTKWMLIAGNGAETTFEAVEMFKKGKYLEK
jgi:hypothetical protein